MNVWKDNYNNEEIYGLLNSISFYNDDNIDYDNKDDIEVSIVKLCVSFEKKRKLLSQKHNIWGLMKKVKIRIPVVVCFPFCLC